MTTTTADNVTPGVEPTPEQTRRGRRTALLLFAVGFGPMVLATIMFYTGWLNPAGHSNQGQLLQPVVPVQALNLRSEERRVGKECRTRCSRAQSEDTHQW